MGEGVRRIEDVLRSDEVIEQACATLQRRLELAGDVVLGTQDRLIRQGNREQDERDARRASMSLAERVREAMRAEAAGALAGLLPDGEVEALAEQAAAHVTPALGAALDVGRRALARLCESLEARWTSAIAAVVDESLADARRTLELLAATTRDVPPAVVALVADRLDEAEGERWLQIDPEAWRLVREAVLPEETASRTPREAARLLDVFDRLQRLVLPEVYLGQPGTGGIPARPARRDEAPTGLLVGPGKVAVMAERVARGVHPHHPGDSLVGEDQAIVPVQSAGNGYKAARSVGGVPVEMTLALMTYGAGEDEIEELPADFYKLRPPTPRGPTAVPPPAVVEADDGDEVPDEPATPVTPSRVPFVASDGPRPRRQRQAASLFD